MRVYHFSEHPYPNAWDDPHGYLRVNLPNRALDPKIAADLFHRYHDEYLLADELGLDLMLNEHHQTATCMNATSIVSLSIMARQSKRGRILILGYPIGHRPDPMRAAEELATIDVISHGRLDMGFVKGVPYEFAPSNANPVGVMDRFWESHDFIIKAMTTHDGPFNWEGEHFHYRQVNLWPRPWQQPHPPVWSTTASKSNARVLGERGYVIAVLGSGRRLCVDPQWRTAGPRPLRLSRAVCDRAQRSRGAPARRIGRRLFAHRRQRVSAVQEPARLFLGRRHRAADARLHAGALLHQGQARGRHAHRQRAGPD